MSSSSDSTPAPSASPLAAAAAAGGGGGAAAPSVSANTCSACGKAAKMQCPTCKELCVAPPNGWFCDKACFTSVWEAHKQYHKDTKAALASALRAVMEPPRRAIPPTNWHGFKFTGSLRPGEVTPQVIVPTGFLPLVPDYASIASDGEPLSEKLDRAVEGRAIEYGPEDVAKAREAARIGREVLDAAAAALRPGITGDELDVIVHRACLERGAYPSPLNYCKFPKSVCISSNEVICHGIPDKRPIASGEIVNLDVSVYTKDGWHSDLNETFCVGAVDAEGVRLVRCAYECLRAAIAICKPGAFYRDIGVAIQRVANAAGFSVVTAYCGHGVGKLFHTVPSIPHYSPNKAVGTMKVGHIFTIEPMINEGKSHAVTWPDNWTAVTKDGKRSAQFEHTLVITPTGCQVLTARNQKGLVTGIEWEPESFVGIGATPPAPAGAKADAAPAVATPAAPLGGAGGPTSGADAAASAAVAKVEALD